MHIASNRLYGRFSSWSVRAVRGLIGGFMVENLHKLWANPRARVWSIALQTHQAERWPLVSLEKKAWMAIAQNRLPFGFHIHIIDLWIFYTVFTTPLWRLYLHIWSTFQFALHEHKRPPGIMKFHFKKVFLFVLFKCLRIFLCTLRVTSFVFFFFMKTQFHYSYNNSSYITVSSIIKKYCTFIKQNALS